MFEPSINAFAEPLVRHFLGIFFLMIGIQFTARSLGLHDRRGFSSIHYGRTRSSAWWHRQLFNILRALILAAVVARIFVDIDGWFGRFDQLYQWPVLVTGMVLLIVAFGLVNYFQAYMNAEWRSGVDPDQKDRLLTEGPFSRSRNPVFMTVMLGQLGFFLALPSVFSLVCLITGVTVMIRQARVEEQALSDAFGSVYESYRQRVPRWF